MSRDREKTKAATRSTPSRGTISQWATFIPQYDEAISRKLPSMMSLLFTIGLKERFRLASPNKHIFFCRIRGRSRGLASLTDEVMSVLLQPPSERLLGGNRVNALGWSQFRRVYCFDWKLANCFSLLWNSCLQRSVGPCGLLSRKKKTGQTDWVAFSLFPCLT